MIYVKTESGQAALLRHSLELTPRQRSAFIMFDGKRSVWDVLKATEGMGITEDDVSHMMAQGLLAVVVNTVQPLGAVAVNAAAAPAPVQSAPDAPSPVAQAHYSNAYPIATRLTAALGLRGFLLNLAVEAATDLAKLQQLAPKIRQAVGPEKFRELENALYD